MVSRRCPAGFLGFFVDGFCLFGHLISISMSLVSGIGVICSYWWGCPRICSYCSRIPGLVGGGLAGLVFWSRAHLSLGYEGVAGCWLVCASSHCRQWKRPIELAISGWLLRSWTLLPSLVFCIYNHLGLFPRKYFVVLKAVFVSKSFDFLDFCCLKPFSICYIVDFASFFRGWRSGSCPLYFSAGMSHHFGCSCYLLFFAS